MVDFGIPKIWQMKYLIPIAVSCISFKDNNGEQVMHLKSDNMQVMTYDKANEVIEEFFDLLLSRYQIGLETSMKGINFIFDLVKLLY